MSSDDDRPKSPVPPPSLPAPNPTFPTLALPSPALSNLALQNLAPPNLALPNLGLPSLEAPSYSPPIRIKSGSEEPGITLDRVAFDYAGQIILDRIDFDLPQGASAVITGPNGSGKSTFLYVAAGLAPPQAGTVLHAGHPLGALFPSTRVQHGLRVGFVFQEGGLLANLDVISNVSLPLRYHADVLGLDETALTERAEEALDAAHVARSEWSRMPAHLSFGLRRRLAMARALAMKPNFFFFDDPDVGIDPRTAQIIHQILCALRDDPDVTLLVATSRPQLIQRLEVPGYRLLAGALSTHSGQNSLGPSMPAAKWPSP